MKSKMNWCLPSSGHTPHCSAEGWRSFQGAVQGTRCTQPQTLRSRGGCDRDSPDVSSRKPRGRSTSIAGRSSARPGTSTWRGQRRRPWRAAHEGTSAHRVERRGTALDVVHDVALVEQQLREVRAVLSGRPNHRRGVDSGATAASPNTSQTARVTDDNSPAACRVSAENKMRSEMTYRGASGTDTVDAAGFSLADPHCCAVTLAP